MKRRTFLKSTGLAGTLGLLKPGFSWAMGNANNGNILITVFLGGGADGLSIVAPVGEGNYHDLRPTLALQPPGGGADASLDVDGFFAMHPAMSKLHQRFSQGELAVVQATGLTNDSHSHFDSQSLMERGIAFEQNIHDGWLNRHLAALSGEDTVFHAVGLHDSLPRTMAGSYPAISMSSIEDFGLDLGGAQEKTLEKTLYPIFETYWQNQLSIHPAT